jgi:hypothetical protein
MYAQKLGRLGGSTNSSFLALVPKESIPSSFNRFHPISLYNASYRIMTEIVARRLKNYMHKFILENQGGFMQNQQIIDNIILVQ